jgi:hypothetical protein
MNLHFHKQYTRFENWTDRPAVRPAGRIRPGGE